MRFPGSCGLFVTCMIALIASLGVFLRDINLSLEALRLELASEDAAGL